jgi:hypothetical protein
MNTMIFNLTLPELKRLYTKESQEFVRALNEETPQQLQERDERLQEIAHRITAHMNHPIHAPFL